MAGDHGLLDLSGRIVIVAGAGGGGIGTLITEMVGNCGATVLALDISQDNLDDHVGPLIKKGLQIVPLACDIQSEEGVSAIIERARQLPGDIYGLVTVVGGIPDQYWGPATRVKRADWQTVMTYNLDTMFFLSTAVAAELHRDGLPGSIVALSSISGLTATPFHIAYGAAKAAVISVVRTMAVELASSGIRINSIAPGAIRTPTAAMEPDRERDRWAVPMGRQGEAAEIASAVLFLLSDMSSYITGQCIPVDGGVSVKWSHLDADNCPAYARDRSFLEDWNA